MLTLERLRTLPTETQKVLVNGQQIEVPADLVPYVEDKFGDFFRWNKRERKKWVPLLVTGYKAFNELVNFDLSEKDYKSRLSSITELHNKIAARLRYLNARVDQITGKENEVGEASVSLEGLKGLVRNELAEWNYLQSIYRTIKRDYDYLLKNQKLVEKQLKKNGAVARQDDVYQDPFIHDYTVAPASRHPFTFQFIDVSNPTLLFAIQNIYSSSEEGNGLGLESNLERMEELHQHQWYTFSTPSTKEFIQAQNQRIQVKRLEVRQCKQALAQTAYDRVTRDLYDIADLRAQEVESLTAFIDKHGQFTTFVMPRADLNHALEFAKKELSNLNKPWFMFFRADAAKKYHVEKTFLETTVNGLEARLYDTRGLIELAKADEGSTFNQLVKDYNAQSKVVNNELSLDNLLANETTPTQGMDNLKNFKAFLGTKKLENERENKNTKWYQKLPFTQSRKAYQDRKKENAFITQLQVASQKSIEERDSLETTKTVKLVVDDQLSQAFIKQYNESRVKNGKPRLYTGTAIQLIDFRQFFHSERQLRDELDTFVRHDRFEVLVKDYNEFRANKDKTHRTKIPLPEAADDEVKKKILEKIRKHSDFSEFVQWQKDKNVQFYKHNEHNDLESIKLQDQQKMEFYSEVQIHMNCIQDRFLKLLNLYNAFRTSKEAEKIELKDIFTFPVTKDQEGKDRLARQIAYDKLMSNRDFKPFMEWYEKQLPKEFKDISDTTRHFGHYLQAMKRELDDPGRFLSTRLNERVQDAYDRFSDLVVYHGVNTANIKQAERYINLIKYSIKRWADSGCDPQKLPVKIDKIDLTDEHQRKNFLEGLDFAKKIIVGEKLDEYIQNGVIQGTFKENLKYVIPESKLDDTGFSAVERLLVTRYSRYHLAQRFSKSVSSQVEIDEGRLEKASIDTLISVITQQTVLNVERQYALIASDAYQYFHKLFFKDANLSNTTKPRIDFKDVITVSSEALELDIESYGKYFLMNEGHKIDRINKEALQANLRIKQNPKKGSEACVLDDISYDWDIKTVKNLLARIQMSPKLKSDFREKLIKPFLEALEKNKDLKLETLGKFAEVFTILFNKDELQVAAKLMLKQVFNPATEGNLSIPTEIEKFLMHNKPYIQAEIDFAIQAYIEKNNEQFSEHNAKVIFKYASQPNRELYCHKKIEEILNEASLNTRGYPDEHANRKVLRFLKFIREIESDTDDFKEISKFAFTDQDALLKLFKPYDSEKGKVIEQHFWRQSIDRLACEYLISSEGIIYIKDIRKAQLKFFLAKNETNLIFASQVKQFFEYTQKFPEEIKFEQEFIDTIFTQFFEDHYNALEHPADKLEVLQIAEQVAVYFDDSKKWLDNTRFKMIEGIISGTFAKFTADNMIDDIKRSKEKKYPITENGKESLLQLMKETLIKPDSKDKKVAEQYNYPNNFEEIFKLGKAFDFNGEISDLVSFVALMNAYNVSDLRLAKVWINDFDNFPITITIKEQLERFFKESISTDIQNKDVLKKFSYHPVAEIIALNFDESRLHLDHARMAKLIELMRDGALNSAQAYARKLIHENEIFNIQFPAKPSSEHELENIFLRFIYPNGVDHEDISTKYNFNPAIEELVNQFGSENVQNKCKIARVAGIFSQLTSNKSLAIDAFVENAKSLKLDDFAKHAKDNDKNELVKLIKFYVESDADWDPRIQKLIEIFEPNDNKKQLLHKYRLKRLKEIFSETGLKFTEDEYLYYQNTMLGQDWQATKTNIKRKFGDTEETFSTIQSLYIPYINNLLGFYARGLLDEAVLEESDVFQLSKMLIGELGLGESVIPDTEPFCSITLEEKRIVGKTYTDVWTMLLRTIGEMKEVKKGINEVEELLKSRDFSNAVQKVNAVSNRIYTNGYKSDKLMLAGIGEVTAELVKTQIAYEKTLSQLEREIKPIAIRILEDKNIVSIRKDVSELLKFFEITPDIASSKLRDALFSLKVREEDLIQNIIRARGSSRVEDVKEFTELLRLLPKDHQQRSKIIVEIQSYYKLLNGAETDLQKLKDKAILLSKYLLMLKKQSNYSRLQSRLKENFRLIDRKSILVDSSIVDNIIDTFKDGFYGKIETLGKNAYIGISSKLIQKIQFLLPFKTPEIIAFLLREKGNNLKFQEEFISIVLKSHKNPKELDRDKTAEMVKELIGFLDEKLFKFRISKIQSIINNCTPQWLEESTLSTVKKEAIKLIEALKPLADFSEDDIENFKIAINAFASKDGTNLSGALLNLYNSRDSNEALLQNADKFIELVNDNHINVLQNEISKNILKAKEKEGIAEKLKVLNENFESKDIKRIVAPLCDLDEKHHLLSHVEDVQSNFLSKVKDKINEECIEQVDYVNKNAESINAAYYTFKAIFSSPSKFTRNDDLVKFTTEQLTHLLKGLDLNRKEEIIKLVRDAYKQQLNKETPYSHYLHNVLEFLNGKQPRALPESLKEFSEYNDKVHAFQSQLDFIISGDYLKIDLEQIKELFLDIKDKLSLHDADILLDKIKQNKIDANNDFLEILSNQLETSKQTVAQQAINIRFNRFTAFVNLVQGIQPNVKKDLYKRDVYEYNILEEAVILECLKKTALMENSASTDNMREIIKQALEKIIDENKGDYSFKLQSVITRFCSEDHQNIMWYQQFLRLHQTIVNVKNEHVSKDCRDSFINQEALQSFLLILKNYSGTEKLSDELHDVIDKIFDEFAKSKNGVHIIVDYAADLIENFGSAVQKEKFEALKFFSDYLHAVFDNTRCSNVKNLDENLRMVWVCINVDNSLYEQAIEHVVQERKNTEAILESVRYVADVINYSHLISEGNLISTAIPNLLVQLFELNSKPLGTIFRERKDMDILVEHIAKIYVQNQLNPFSVHGGSRVKPSEIKDKFDKFVQTYIQLRNDHDNIWDQSIPCSSKFAENLILRLGTYKQVEAMKNAKKGADSAFQKEQEAFKFASQLVHYIIDLRRSSSQSIISNAKNVIDGFPSSLSDNLKHGEKSVALFIKHFNDIVSNAPQLKLAIIKDWEKSRPLGLSDLQDIMTKYIHKIAGDQFALLNKTCSQEYTKSSEYTATYGVNKHNH